MSRRRSCFWIWSLCPGLGCVAWLHAAVVTRDRRYVVFAALYAVPTVLLTATSDANGDSPGLVGIVWFASWAGSAVHARRARGSVDEAANGGPTWIGWHPDSDQVTERYWDGSAWTAVRIRLAGPTRRAWAGIWVIGAGLGLLMLLPGDESGSTRTDAAIMMCLLVVGLAAVIVGLRRSRQITVDDASVRVSRRRYALDEIVEGTAREEPGHGWGLHLRLADGREIESRLRFADRAPVEAVVSLIRRA